MPIDKNLKNSKLMGANLSDSDLRKVDFSGADLKNTNLMNTKLHDACLTAWDSGQLEGVKIAGEEGWVPTDEWKDLSKAKFKGSDLSDSDLSGFDLTGADMQNSILVNTDFSGCNLQNANLMKANLQGVRLSHWISGQLQGVKLAGAKGWVPADKNMRDAKLKNADLSGSDLSGVDLSRADLRGTILVNTNLQGANLESTNLQETNLCGAILHTARGDRPATKVPVTSPSGKLERDLKVGNPVVFELTAPRALTLRRVTLCILCDGDGDQSCDKQMEVQTGPSATGLSWTSVVKFTFTPRQRKQEQTFEVAPDAPLLTGFVRVLVCNTQDFVVTTSSSLSSCKKPARVWSTGEYTCASGFVFLVLVLFHEWHKGK